MKIVPTTLVVVAALVATTRANAAYTGLSVTSVNTTVTFSIDPNQTAVTIHRVWANFTDANESLFVWGGGGSLGAGMINNLHASGTGPGTGFINDFKGGLQPPTPIIPSVSDRDSYFTIGITNQDQIPPGLGIQLFSVPGSPDDVIGTSINLSTGGGIATPPTTNAGDPNPISAAGFTGDGDTALRVLLMSVNGVIVHFPKKRWTRTCCIGRLFTRTEAPCETIHDRALQTQPAASFS